MNNAVAAKIIRHINHHGGDNEDWYVGIREKGSNRDDRKDRHPILFELSSEEEAKQTMSGLLGMGLTADDEYDAEPTVIFVYTHGK